MFIVETGESPTRAAPVGLRERNKQDKLARIKRAARELFAKKGFEGATARAICRRAGIATGTLFLYARDKRELLFLVFRDEVHEILRQRTARTCTTLPLADALMHLFRGFLDFYARSPELSRVIAGEFFYRTQQPAAMNALTEDYLAAIAALVERGRAGGELRTDVAVPDQVNAFFAHYAFHAQAWLADAVVDRQQVDRSLRRALELQIEGLAPPAVGSGSRQRTHQLGRRGR
ncbi:MAG: TetR/AcrR family transcriptional regulator [Deltaproteobacteria bacterium]|nr:TetR/AcrR family transcriptional regulator [Deltaproteobacteria bacterium]